MLDCRRGITIGAALLLIVGRAGTSHALPGDPFELGVIPPDSPSGPITGCENRVAKAAARLLSALVKCETLRARETYPDDDTMRVQCKQVAGAKFLRTGLAGCPPCIDLPSLEDEIQNAVGGSGSPGLDEIYCATATGPCTRAGASCTCTTGPFSGDPGRCEQHVDGVHLYCTAAGGCSPNACAQDSDCPLQLGSPTICVHSESTPPGWTCCLSPCD